MRRLTNIKILMADGINKLNQSIKIELLQLNCYSTRVLHPEISIELCPSLQFCPTLSLPMMLVVFALFLPSLVSSFSSKYEYISTKNVACFTNKFLTMIDIR